VKLTIGAGLSIPFGLPNWKKLVSRLFALKNEPTCRNKSCEDAVEYFRHKFYNNDYDGYLNAVNKALYPIFRTKKSPLFPIY